jgi:ABC-type uncharacterized transport system substrate-binding protein
MSSLGRPSVALPRKFHGALINSNQVHIITLAMDARLPTIYVAREYVDAGRLIPHLFRRAAELVDKILRGAKPRDIPVEQPTKFGLFINLAKVLGLAIPQTLSLPRTK